MSSAVVYFQKWITRVTLRTFCMKLINRFKGTIISLVGDIKCMELIHEQVQLNPIETTSSSCGSFSLFWLCNENEGSTHDDHVYVHRVWARVKRVFIRLDFHCHSPKVQQAALPRIFNMYEHSCMPGWLSVPLFSSLTAITRHTPTGRTHSIDTQQGFEAGVMAKTNHRNDASSSSPVPSGEHWKQRDSQTRSKD